MMLTLKKKRVAPEIRTLTVEIKRLEERLAQIEATTSQSVVKDTSQPSSEPAEGPTIGERAMKYIGKYRSGKPDGAERAEEEYYEGLWQRYREGHV